MNDQNTTTPAATTTLSTPAKDHAGVQAPLPMQAPKADAVPAEAIPAKA